MVTRALETRARIVRDAASVFGTRGFFGTSMSDLLSATGLQKGGLYNHFGSKEQLALEAFDYAVSLITGRYVEAFAATDSQLDRLYAIVDVISALIDDPALPGGCPILNAAVESDDVLPVLRERAQEAMTSWLRLIGSTAKAAVEAGELRAEVDPRQLATVVTATLEGAVMLSKLYGDPSYMHRAVDHVTAHIRSFATAPAAAPPRVRRTGKKAAR
jgi:AcrR family transcriptional regulator